MPALELPLRGERSKGPNGNEKSPPSSFCSRILLPSGVLRPSTGFFLDILSMQNRKESTCLSPVSSSTTVPKLPFSRKENIPSPCRVQFRGRIYLLRARSDPEVSSTENQTVGRRRGGPWGPCGVTSAVGLSLVDVLAVQ